MLCQRCGRVVSTGHTRPECDAFYAAAFDQAHDKAVWTQPTATVRHQPVNGVRLLLDNLRKTAPSPEVLRVVEQIEAEQDALAEAWDEGYQAACGQTVMSFTPDGPSDKQNPYRPERYAK